MDEAFVLELARLAGIELTPEQLPGVIATLRINAGLARKLDDFPLAAEDEPGPVWRP